MVKKKLAFYLLLLFSCTAFAQKYTPVIKKGTVLSYKVMSRSSGQEGIIILNISSLKDTMKINWSLPYSSSGSFEITPKALQSGTKLTVNEPADGEVTRLNDNETLLSISKDGYNNLVNNKSFVLNGVTFYAKPDTSSFKIDDKEANIIYVADEKGKRQLWILNSPSLPLICKSIKAAKGIDFELISLQNN
jgi:hypothetical protein